jgi:hypothetical protein
VGTPARVVNRKILSVTQLAGTNRGRCYRRVREIAAGDPSPTHEGGATFFFLRSTERARLLPASRKAFSQPRRPHPGGWGPDRLRRLPIPAVQAVASGAFQRSVGYYGKHPCIPRPEHYGEPLPTSGLSCSSAQNAGAAGGADDPAKTSTLVAVARHRLSAILVSVPQCAGPSRNISWVGHGSGCVFFVPSQRAS